MYNQITLLYAWNWHNMVINCASIKNNNFKYEAYRWVTSNMKELRKYWCPPFWAILVKDHELMKSSQPRNEPEYKS